MSDPSAIADGPPVPLPGAGGPDDDEGWGSDSLTEQQILALAALDAELLDDDQDWDGPELAGDLDAGGDPGPVQEALPGRLDRGGGLDAGGAGNRIPPGPVLAGLAARRGDQGLSRVGDDELAGLLIAWARLEAWAAAGKLAAVAELDRRRWVQVTAGADPHLAEHVADEVGMVLTLTARAADRLVDRAVGLARLPKTTAALAAGDIDVAKALVILGEVSGLAGPHAAKVEAAVIGRAPEWTTGQLRRAVRRQVIATDPSAARRGKEKALRQARVERWAEPAGTAALAGRDLPPAQVLAADAHLTTWARRLKAAGVDGGMDQLRAKVYLALLNGQSPESLLPAADPTPAGSSRPAADPSDPGHPAEPASAVAGQSARPAGPVVHGAVNLTLSLATWLGWSASPGEAAGYGPLDAGDSRALAAALGRDPATRWCLTITGAGGRPLAHGCAKHGPSQPPTQRGQPPPPCGHPPAEPSSRPPPATAYPGDAGPGPPPPAVAAWLAAINLAWLGPGECRHEHQSQGYRPSPRLAHLVQIRQRTCTAPGCQRPATQCDAEHTIPYHQGGRTCLCNLGPCCRRHHRAKQAAGWRLSQPQPGTFTWSTPHGRSYITYPAEYSC